ncbi:uncharacterized protein LOC125370303 [Ricinus communis]|uniref:uncharacterized protein LOC125370303 n=1 Tax=Ricinus communis TaxID=3988 RepID=UPI00201AE5B0|nr:uncharacterized protein LOC125370303 [Ricinus communis]
MKESGTVKEYFDKLLRIANQVRLLGYEFPDSRLVQKILVTIPERHKNREGVRCKGVIEGALAAKASSSYGGKGKKVESYKKENSGFDSLNTNMGTKSYFSPCKHCGRENHPPWKSNNQQKTVTQENVQQKNVAQVADEEEEQLFVATCFAASNSSEKWLIDSGCTNHMTFDHDLFKELDTFVVSKVMIGNGEKITVKGKGTVAIESISVKMNGKSFALDPLEEEQAAFPAAKIHSEIWHKRLGHFNQKAIVNLQRMELKKWDKLDKGAESGIFVGYISVSKAYRIFQPNTKKILISRDVHFMENDEWVWDKKQGVEFPVRGMRSLSDIYERCNVAVLEPIDFWEAEKDPK